MMKCDMCYDRTSIGLKPMCATVCPSGALFYGTPEELAAERSGTPINEFMFGNKKITTKVHLMRPRGTKQLTVKPDAVVRRTDLLTAVRQVEC